MHEEAALRSTRRHAGLVPAIVAAALVAGGCTSSGSQHSAGGSTTTAPVATSSGSSGGNGAGSGSVGSGGVAAAALQQAIVSVVSKVRPQVVQISTSTGLGSGVIYDKQGDIVTNAHVVGSATTFTVQLVNGQHLPGTLVGVYAPDDLAVVRVKGGNDLSVATFGNSSALQVGDIVFAVGNPLGLSSSVTEGIVSYNGRSVSEGNGVVLPNTIQTSAAINPGNSGGALADLNGDVIGIPTLAATDQQIGGAAAGIGFAIPSNVVKLIASQLISTGHVNQSNRAALGISAADAVDPSGAPVGALVIQVAPGGSAAKAGIQAGEVITAINGTPVTSLSDLQTVLAQLAPGQTAKVKLLDSSGNSRTVDVVLGQLQG